MHHFKSAKGNSVAGKRRRRLARILLTLAVPALVIPGCLEEGDPGGPKDGGGDALGQAHKVPGYLFFVTGVKASVTPMSVLTDMKGKVVKQWSMFGLPARLLPGGSLLGASGKHLDSSQSYLAYQEVVQLLQLSWDGKQTWSFSDWEKDAKGALSSRQHHDLQREGNPVGYHAPGQDPAPAGKTLVLAYGRTVAPHLSTRTLQQDDVIYELSAAGKMLGFRWRASDHFDELGFDTRARADIKKWLDQASGSDQAWLHLNSMATLGRNKWYEDSGDKRFHPDNIIVSSRRANLIAIISRATGKIVWRVGPDFASGHPEAGLGQLVGQHHAHMIPYGLPGAGNILVFDNGGLSGFGGAGGYPQHARNYSRILEFDPVSLKVIWQYGGPMGSPDYFFCAYMGAVQRLPNGNTQIVHALESRLIEVSPGKEKVWSLDLEAKKRGWVERLYRAIRVPPEWLPAGINPAGYTPWKALSP